MTREQRELQRLAIIGRIGKLDELKRAIVILRLGWDHNKPRSQQQVANELGLSQPYVSNLERQAKRSLAEA